MVDGGASSCDLGDAEGVLDGNSFVTDIFFSPKVLEIDGLDFAAEGDSLGEAFVEVEEVDLVEDDLLLLLDVEEGVGDGDGNGLEEFWLPGVGAAATQLPSDFLCREFPSPEAPKSEE